MQPIGGLNQKIEGFHDVCRLAGFSGTQGVMMPVRNKRNLMLRKDVLESVEQGNFHIYAVDSVDEAIELLTGVEAGERDDEGKYPEGTINRLVEDRLRVMGETLRRFGRPQRPEQVDGERSRDDERDAEDNDDDGDPEEPKPDGDGDEPGDDSGD